MNRRIIGAALAAGTLSTALSATAAGAHEPDHHRDRGGEATYTVTVENLTMGQWLTPPNWAAHDRMSEVFSARHAASAGVQAVAENGGVPVLAAELMDRIDGAGHGVSGVAPADGPVAPGMRVSFDVTTDEQRFSLVAMLVCTNDGFAGLDSKRLPRWAGDSVSYSVGAYDAGTEVNTEARKDLVPAPFCGAGEGSGMSNPDLAEHGVIHRHAGIMGVGDLGPQFGWDGPVARVTIERH